MYGAWLGIFPQMHCTCSVGSLSSPVTSQPSAPQPVPLPPHVLYFSLWTEKRTLGVSSANWMVMASPSAFDLLLLLEYQAPPLALNAPSDMFMYAQSVLCKYHCNHKVYIVDGWYGKLHFSIDQTAGRPLPSCWAWHSTLGNDCCKMSSVSSRSFQSCSAQRSLHRRLWGSGAPWQGPNTLHGQR